MEFINATLSRFLFAFWSTEDSQALILSLRSLRPSFGYPIKRYPIQIEANIAKHLFTDDSLRELVLIRLILLHLEFFRFFFSFDCIDEILFNLHNSASLLLSHIHMSLVDRRFMLTITLGLIF